MPRILEAMRYRDADCESKMLWINETLEWVALNGNTVFSIGAVTWFDEGDPWAVFDVEEIAYNTDVREYILARGP
jgi:hypothetical protein